MYFDISEIGAIRCQLNFDEDEYLDYLSDNGLKDTPENKNTYIKEYCVYDISYLDSEYFHDMGKYDTMTLEEISDEFGENLANSVFTECMSGREEEFEISAYQNDVFDIHNPNELNAVAVKYLRHGNYFKNCRGFILTNGVVVYTDSEHNQCSKIPGIKGTFDFIHLGNIRVLDHGLDISTPPTKAQWNTLNEVFDTYYGEPLYLDLCNKEIGHMGQNYSQCDSNEVREDIINYFKGNGIKRRLYEKKNTIKLNENTLKLIIAESIRKILKECNNIRVD